MSMAVIRWGTRLRRVAVPLFIACSLWLVIFPFMKGHFALTETTGGSVLVALADDVAMVGAFAACVAGAPLLMRMLGWRRLAQVGLVSYSAFLLHETVMLVGWKLWLQDRTETISVWLSGGTWASWTAFLCYMLAFSVATLAISYLSYRFVESPFLKRKPK